MEVQDSRGLKDPEGYKRKLAKREEIEKEAQRSNQDGGGGLKVN